MNPSPDTATASPADPFVDYYEKQSISAESFARFGRVFELMLRFRRAQGLPDENLHMLDIGCNAGTQAFMWAERGHVVHGLDINEPLLEIARKRSRDKGLPIDFRVGSATSLPWPDGSMDVCLMPELLEHIEDWQDCLAEASRVLKPGGTLYLSTTNRMSPRQMEFDLPAYGWYPERIKKRFEKLAVTTRPQLVHHAEYPAVNWFTPYELCRQLTGLGFQAWDHFDWIDTRQKSIVGATAARLIRAIPPLRWLAHIATPYSMVIGTRI